MRPVQIIATAVFVAALAVTGCTSRTDQPVAPVSSGPSSVPTTQPTAATTTHSTAGSAGTTTTTVATPANARCTLSCRGFAPSEQVAVTFGATVLATATATAGGEVAASFAVPSGFAGSHYPGRKDTFQAKGHQSGKVGSGTFTVTG
jgi:hypothetical protein